MRGDEGQRGWTRCVHCSHYLSLSQWPGASHVRRRSRVAWSSHGQSNGLFRRCCAVTVRDSLWKRTRFTTRSLVLLPSMENVEIREREIARGR